VAQVEVCKAGALPVSRMLRSFVDVAGATAILYPFLAEGLQPVSDWE